ncbi:MAG TPA: J domain-containing protein [Rhabdochlamydiaceae bacterium]|nr:J domain-containing protein [Rhabdochlamydiaceae bacterium]
MIKMPLLTERVPSFTEYALLNRFALDILYPPDFQKLPLSYKGDSALEAIKTAKVNPYSNLRNISYWHAADRFYLLTPLRFIYNACVILTISRLGMLYNGAMTLCHYLRYRCSREVSQIDKAWEKAKTYAYAFFADTVCGILGGFVIKGVVQCTVCTLNDLGVISLLGQGSITLSFYPLLFNVLVAASAVLGVIGLSLLQSPSVAPDFFAPSDHRVGMYLSLFFRKKLGLINDSGGLLSFSQRDQLVCNAEGEFSGKNYETLTEQTMEAEFQLIETVQKCNQLLPNGKKIEFQYPFNGDAIAKVLEHQVFHEKSVNSSQALGNLDPLLLKADQMRSLQAKIRNAREAWGTAQKITFSDSYLMILLKLYTKDSVKRLNLPDVPSLLSKADYIQYFTYETFFNEPPRQPAYEQYEMPEEAHNTKYKMPEEEAHNTTPFFRYWYNIGLAAIDPKEKKRPTAIFDAFCHDLAVNKWNAHQGIETFKTHRQLLGMDDNTSFLDFKQIKKRYHFALHPDRNQTRKLLATELTKYLNEILDHIESQYESEKPKAPNKRTNEDNRFREYWFNISLDAIDPTRESSRPPTLFEGFEYDLCVNKWKAHHKQSDFRTHREFFGMDTNTSLASFEQIKKDYLMALDPDRNEARKLLATKLTKYLNEMLEHIQSEYANQQKKEV